MRWETDKIVELLGSADWGVEVHPAGGDYDTEGVLVTPHGTEDEHLFICGFRTEAPLPVKSDADIEMVEVSDGQDSRGGCSSQDERLTRAYGIVCAKLRQAGYQVVPSMDDYF